MKEQVKQFKGELEILNWYIQVLEDGKSSKGLFEKNIQLKKEIQALKEKNEKDILRLEAKCSDTRNRLEMTLEKLRI